eukprot:3265164-Rhodomonas_salina.1
MCVVPAAVTVTVPPGSLRLRQPTTPRTTVVRRRRPSHAGASGDQVACSLSTAAQRPGRLGTGTGSGPN